MLNKNQKKEESYKHANQNEDLNKRSTSLKTRDIKSNDLLFAFNYENKYKSIKKVTKYSQFKKVPSGKNNINFIYNSKRKKTRNCIP